MKDFWQDEVHLRKITLVTSDVQEDQELNYFLGVLLLVQDDLLNCVKDHVLVLRDALRNEVDDCLEAVIEPFDVLWAAVHAISTY